MKIHPYGEIFPSMSPTELSQLEGDIEKHGCRQPIVTFEGKILDGRHRWHCCRRLDIQPKQVAFRGTSEQALAYVISQNLYRRHLTPSQRAMIAKELLPELEEKAKERQKTSTGGSKPQLRVNVPEAEGGRHQLRVNVPEAEGRARDQAGEVFNVSGSLVEKAKKIADADPELAKKVRDGEMTLNQAAKELEKPAKVLDATGYPIPKALHGLWERRGEVERMLRAVANIKNVMKDLEDAKDILVKGVKVGALVMEADRLHGSLGTVRLFAVCPTCQGMTPEGCQLCRGRGIISKFLWDTAVPDKTKQIRQAIKSDHSSNNETT